MELYFGAALVAAGAFLWWRQNQQPPAAVVTKEDGADSRIALFDAYLLLSDHVEKCGTPEHKSALASILPCIASQKK